MFDFLSITSILNACLIGIFTCCVVGPMPPRPPRIGTLIARFLTYSIFSLFIFNFGESLLKEIVVGENYMTLIAFLLTVIINTKFSKPIIVDKLFKD